MIRTILLGLFFLIAFTTSYLFQAQPAQASTTSCGQVVCYVDTSVRGESNWEEEITDDGTGSSEPGGGGGTTTPRFLYTYKSCDTWLPQGGGISTHSFPAVNSGSFNCNFSDGGAFYGDQGEIYYQCAPRGDRASNGRVNAWVMDGERRVFAFYYCLYPTDEFAPIERQVGSGKIYTGGRGDFYRTVSATQARQPIRTGTSTDSTGYIDRGVNLSNPEGWSGTWQPSFTARTGETAAGDPLYGYYRLLWVLDYRVCVKYAYPSWLNQPVRYDCSEAGTDTTVRPYTYACDTNPPLQEGIRSNALFRAADCVPSWECVLTGDTLVGGERESVTVMRNGENTEVRNPTPGVRISTPTRIRDVRSWKALRTITPGSTPSADYVNASWEWEKWGNHTATSNISFNWASETASQPFSWDTRYRFTADYLVPKQDRLNGGVSYVWVTQTSDCLENDSPDVLVVRSASR